MPQNKRFKALCDKWGFTIHPVVCRINGKWARREDILTVERHGEWEMTIPKKMYAISNTEYRDLLGLQHPTFFDCESKLYDRKYAER